MTTAYKAITVHFEHITKFSNPAKAKAFCMNESEQFFTLELIEDDMEKLGKLAMHVRVDSKSPHTVWKSALDVAKPSIFDEPEIYKPALQRKTVKMYYAGDRLIPGAYDHLPPQARTILDALSDKLPMTENELGNFIFNLQQEGLLRTKQNPMRVFKYYLPKYRTIKAIIETEEQPSD